MREALRNLETLIRNDNPVLVITDHATYSNTENPKTWDHLRQRATWRTCRIPLVQLVYKPGAAPNAADWRRRRRWTSTPASRSDQQPYNLGHASVRRSLPYSSTTGPISRAVASNNSSCRREPRPTGSWEPSSDSRERPQLRQHRQGWGDYGHPPSDGEMPSPPP